MTCLLGVAWKNNKMWYKSFKCVCSAFDCNRYLFKWKEKAASRSVNFCQTLVKDHQRRFSLWTQVTQTARIPINTSVNNCPLHSHAWHHTHSWMFYCLCSSSRKGVTVFPPTLTVNDRWKLSCSNPPHPSTHQPPQFSPRAPIRLLQLLRWRLHLMSETLSQMFAEHLEGPRRIHTSSLFRSLRTRFL